MAIGRNQFQSLILYNICKNHYWHKFIKISGVVYLLTIKNLFLFLFFKTKVIFNTFQNNFSRPYNYVYWSKMHKPILCKFSQNRFISSDARATDIKSFSKTHFFDLRVRYPKTNICPPKAQNGFFCTITIICLYYSPREKVNPLLSFPNRK